MQNLSAKEWEKQSVFCSPTGRPIMQLGSIVSATIHKVSRSTNAYVNNTSNEDFLRFTTNNIKTVESDEVVLVYFSHFSSSEAIIWFLKEAICLSRSWTLFLIVINASLIDIWTIYLNYFWDSWNFTLITALISLPSVVKDSEVGEVIFCHDSVDSVDSVEAFWGSEKREKLH